MMTRKHIRRDGTVRCWVQDRYIRYANGTESERRRLKPPAPYRTWAEIEADLIGCGQIRDRSGCNERTIQ